VSWYVDLEAGGGDAARAMPALAQHLHQCGVCHEEYEVLRDLARADVDGAPPVDDPPDLPQLASFWPPPRNREAGDPRR
jgi:hypothetical protein